MPLTMVLRKSRPGYKFVNSVKINHLMYMDDLHPFCKDRNYIESLVHTVRIFSDDIGMTFEIDKCVFLVMKRGKVEPERGRIQTPIGKSARYLRGQKQYRYLGMLEGSEIRHQ